MNDAADELLHAFAHSDLTTIERLCTDDVLLVGTEADELWQGRERILAAFAGAFDLDVRWVTEPVRGDCWLFGICAFTDAHDTETTARVTMIFRDGRLSHAHYSTAQ